MLTYKFRIYPKKSQQEKLWRHANKLNWLYNQFLDQKIKAYETEKRFISRYDLQNQIPIIKKEDNVLREIHSQVIQQVTYRLDKTYKSFFKRGFGFPKFRSCRKFFSIVYPQSGYSIKDKTFHTKVYGDIKFIKHRDIEGNIKTATIKNENNRWFLCITTDFKKDIKCSGIIGIDVGITNLAALSNGTIIKNKTHAKYFDKHINKLKSRRDSQCKKGSRKSKYLSQVVKRLYGVKNRKINDFQHKVTCNLSREFDIVVVEDLDTKKMSEGKITGLNRELRNSKLSSFIDKLEYKTNELIKVNPMNTSKTCNSCGKLQSMPLSKRTYACTCGYSEDRDVNAAKNIICLGQAILAKECTGGSTIQEALSFR